MNSEHELHDAAHGGASTPVHQDVTFESKDINAATIFKYMVGLGVTVAIAFAVTIAIFRITNGIASGSDRAMPPAHKGVGPTLPPEPRLQGVPGHDVDPQEDLRNKIAVDEEANRTLGWVDRPAGIAQIPVDDAMRILVSKGVPAPATSSQEKKP